ncbi:MAG TPA: 5'-nucleotidase [Sphingobacteriaceae bacterium]|nr:5'-nucleotidase [Sphingobacteriaceae bacterium]
MIPLRTTKTRAIYLPVFLFLISLGGCAPVFFIPSEHNHSQYEISAEIPADPKIEHYIAPFKDSLESVMNSVIGQSEQRLTKSGGQSETLLGNFFADALLQEGRKHDPEIEFSFGTKGGLRIELPQGDITVGHIFELMPFENKLVILELSADKIEQLAQYIAASNGQPIAGMTLEISNGRAQNIQIGGQALQKNKVYKLLTYDYLANGGDNSKGLDNPISRVDLSQKVRETLLDYIEGMTEKGQSINTQLDGRVKTQ